MVMMIIIMIMDYVSPIVVQGSKIKNSSARKDNHISILVWWFLMVKALYFMMKFPLTSFSLTTTGHHHC